MAFANKIGNLVKQSVSSNPSLLQSIRCMSSSKLFVGGLSWGTDDGALKDAFNNYGEVVEARVIMDRESGRSRGFGFVTFSSTDDAQAAITAMDGKDLDGRMLKVNYANDRAGGFQSGGGGGFGQGGYGGGQGGYGGGYGGAQGGGYGGAQGGGYGGARGGYGGAGSVVDGSGGNFGGNGGSFGGGNRGAFGGGEKFNAQDDLLGDLDDEPSDYANKRG